MDYISKSKIKAGCLLSKEHSLLHMGLSNPSCTP